MGGFVKVSWTSESDSMEAIHCKKSCFTILQKFLMVLWKALEKNHFYSRLSIIYFTGFETPGASTVHKRSNCAVSIREKHSDSISGTSVHSNALTVESSWTSLGLNGTWLENSGHKMHRVWFQKGYFAARDREVKKLVCLLFGTLKRASLDWK